MRVYTIGFTQKSAREFFDKIKSNNIGLVLDIRLNNVSQLAGFAKGKDLQYFLKEICNCQYIHDTEFAPTKEILANYRSNNIDWNVYTEKFTKLAQSRALDKRFKNLYGNYQNVCLLCTEPTPINCHRRLVAELLKEKYSDIEVVHI